MGSVDHEQRIEELEERMKIAFMLLRSHVETYDAYEPRLAALEATATRSSEAPTHTDLMVTPESLDKYLRDSGGERVDYAGKPSLESALVAALPEPAEAAIAQYRDEVGPLEAGEGGSSHGARWGTGDLRREEASLTGPESGELLAPLTYEDSMAESRRYAQEYPDVNAAFRERHGRGMGEIPAPAPMREVTVPGEERRMDSRDKIEAAFNGIFTRLERQTAEVRGMVIWALTSRWCLGCGETYDVCEAAGECGDNVCCCGTPRRTVIAEQCPKCEMIVHASVRPSEPATAADVGDPERLAVTTEWEEVVVADDGDEQETLKPCPFCGEAGYLEVQTEPSWSKYAPWMAVYCTKCDASAETAKDEAEAVGYWNRRVPESGEQP